MKIYISGISGTGMGPLALMALKAGHEVYGSDLTKGAIYDELLEAGVDVMIGEQDGEFLRAKLLEGVDWFVYTSALPEDHTELMIARSAGVKISKRDELTAFLVKELGLKMVAVAGTHGKTTTTAMIVWGAIKLGLPVSYVVGTTLGFAPSGAYHAGDKYFVYEADEYDRNFLKFHPWLAVITCVSYDHPDIYKTPEDYKRAFVEFEQQSEKVYGNSLTHVYVDGDPNSGPAFPDIELLLAGEARREDEWWALVTLREIMINEGLEVEDKKIADILNEFPGVGRRFERLIDGVYTDYAHHPEEIMATIDVALDECRMRGYKGVVAVYQPHQNTRQHEVRDGYLHAFDGVKRVYWLPTYLTRENLDLVVLTPEDLISDLANRGVAEPANLDDELFGKLMKWRDDGYLILLMTAGPADGWLRNKVRASNLLWDAYKKSQSGGVES
ncbi:hypothetical protein IJG04_02145 [Candidatus Saccharibacteria bacterium]|nr:hypothetical protein [Candidatus Saccharibacteria bacterium]